MMDVADAMDALETELVRARREVDREAGQREAAERVLAEHREEAEALEVRREALDEAIAVLSSYADERQAALQAKVEGLVTHGLRTIFGDDLSFHILTSTSGKLTTADFVVRSTSGGEMVETDIMSARGGGVAAVVGFLLRLLMALLRDDAEPILFLDETFAQLSAEYEPALAEFMRELVDKSPAQLVLVTHSTAYDDVADIAYRLTLEDGRTRVERVGAKGAVS